MQKFLLLIPLIFVVSCTRSTQFQNESECAPCLIIYGHSKDWDNISDDLARNIYRNNKICEEYNNDE